MRDKEIKKAIEILKNGGIVIFPTDTAYGIGCKMDDEKAVKRLFEIKKRPKTQAVPVLVDSIEMAQKYSKPARLALQCRAGRHLTFNIKQLMKDYWPGGLTIVLPCKTELVPDLVRGGGETIGLRVPNHPIPLKLIKELGAPLLGPSANFHNQPTPYSFKELSPELLKLVDYVIKGDCYLKKASTVIDVSAKDWKILRQGAVKIVINDKKKINLLIDTSNNQETMVGLEINGQKYFSQKEKRNLRAQELLPLLDSLLKENHLKIKDISQIKVSRGPGSFTGLRVGISIANALAFILGIPINDKEKGEMETPLY